MNYWIIADTHFGHKKLIEFREQNYEKIILKNIKSKVKHEDVLIHLGDFAFKDIAYWAKVYHEAHKGASWLIRGNHDNQNISWYYTNGFSVVLDYATLNIYGKWIVFSHVPFDDNSMQNHLIDINVHGHLHNSRHHDIKPAYVCFNIDIEKDLSPYCLRSIVESQR